MFEDKPKPSDKADKAAANLAIKGGKVKDSPPVEKKVVEKLKQEAGSMRFTTATFKKHAEKVDKATYKTSSSRLCYWCVEEECLKGRMRKWYKEKRNEAKTKEYATFRHQMDKLTNFMCPKYTEVSRRMEQGAEIYKATNPDSEDEVNSEEESMSDTEEEPG